MDTRAIRLPDHLVDTVARVAAERSVTPSELIREAIEAYCNNSAAPRSRIDLLDRLVTYRGSGKPDLGSRSEEHLRAMFDARRRPR